MRADANQFQPIGRPWRAPFQLASPWIRPRGNPSSGEGIKAFKKSNPSCGKKDREKQWGPHSISGPKISDLNPNPISGGGCGAMVVFKLVSHQFDYLGP